MTQQRIKIGGFGSWLWVIGMVILISVVQLPLLQLNHGSLSHRVLWSGIYLAGFVITALIGFWRYRQIHPVNWQRLTGQDWVQMVKGYGFIILSEFILSGLTSVLYHQTSTANNQAIGTLMGRSSLTMILFSLTAVLGSPIIEELTFRGLLIDGCFAPRSFWLSIVVSGIAFSIPHASSNPISWLLYAVMGGTLAYVYRRTGKLQSSILLHGFNNLVAVGLMLLTLK